MSNPSAAAHQSSPNPPPAPARPGVIPFPAGKPVLVDADSMARTYDEVKTPYKYGIILRGGADEIIDCPNIFRHGNRWYMMYISSRSNVGYETCLARSDDLLRWEKLGVVLPLRSEGWDAWQAAGGIALYDTRWDGSHELTRHDGRYWLPYLGGSKKGYEPDPLSIGLACTDDPVAIRPWERLPENPVLSADQSDARDFEHVTLYKSAIIRDESRSLGAPFVMYYNGKSAPYGNEGIGIAISHDMRTWTRFGRGPVLMSVGSSPWAISGDPQITRIGDLWVMHYFGAFWDRGAFDTFACSRNLIHWTKWNGPHLIAPTEPFDQEYAHKPWVLKHDGIVYHFYCATGAEGRVIALATSRDLGRSS
ncbi:MAG: glycosylase [Opitutaceae bacterium]|nr:glycosylase [Opitutaceae bacterium]